MKTMKNLFKSIPVLVLSLTLSAQEAENLVTNGNFDQISGKLRRTGMISAADGWISPTGVPADLFSAQAKMPEVETPNNLYGREKPKEGDSYAGIVVYSYNDKEKRQYLTTKLNTPLKKGMRYKVMFYASLAEMSKYSSNRVGVHFNKKEISTKDKVPALILETHIEHPDQEIFSGMYGWDLVCGEYIAKGGEKFLTIGNFYPNNEVGNERNKTPRDIKGTPIVAAYYYIDAVSVTLLGPDERCDCPYGDEAETVSATLYQRRPEITDRMPDDEKLKAHKIFYTPERYNLTISGEGTLDEIAKLLEKNPTMQIRIVGHTDTKESASASAKDVSMKRAEYVKLQLEERGIDSNRMMLKDAQDSQKASFIEDNDNEDTRLAKSRRVTFEVVSK